MKDRLQDTWRRPVFERVQPVDAGGKRVHFQAREALDIYPKPADAMWRAKARTDAWFSVYGVAPTP